MTHSRPLPGRLRHHRTLFYFTTPIVSPLRRQWPLPTPTGFSVTLGVSPGTYPSCFFARRPPDPLQVKRWQRWWWWRWRDDRGGGSGGGLVLGCDCTVDLVLVDPVDGLISLLLGGSRFPPVVLGQRAGGRHALPSCLRVPGCHQGRLRSPAFIILLPGPHA